MTWAIRFDQGVPETHRPCTGAELAEIDEITTGDVGINIWASSSQL